MIGVAFLYLWLLEVHVFQPSCAARTERHMLYVILLINLSLDHHVGEQARALQTFVVVYKFLNKSWREYWFFAHRSIRLLRHRPVYSLRAPYRALEALWLFYAHESALLYWYADSECIDGRHWSEVAVQLLTWVAAVVRLRSREGLVPAVEG